MRQVPTGWWSVLASRQAYSLLDQVYGQAYSLTWLSRADEMIGQLKSTPPDICLIDFQLGGRTGIELIEQMQTEGFSRIPTILITDSGHRDHRFR